MSWATEHIKKLQEGETVQFRPKGNSMDPLIKSGQLCTVMPLEDHVVHKGDILLCKVGRSHYIHLVTGVKQKLNDQRIQIGNNKGHTNGTIGRGAVYGRLIKVED